MRLHTINQAEPDLPKRCRIRGGRRMDARTTYVTISCEHPTSIPLCTIDDEEMAQSSPSAAVDHAATSTSNVETVWTKLNDAHATLSALKRQSTAASLHGLNAQTCDRIGSTSSSSSSQSKHLNREQFKQLIADLRSTTSSFRQTSQSLLTQQPVQGSQINPNRYHSLLKERSQHVAQLHSAQDPLLSLQSRLRQRRQKVLPAKLHVGALSADFEQSDVAKGKRKRQDQDTQHIIGLPLDSARPALGSISSALEDLAKELQLETFAEAIDASLDGSDKYIHTHTLTIGGRLLVLDVELGLKPATAAHFAPSSKVKTSFTTDTSQPTSSSDGQDREKLTRCLQDDIQSVCEIIFGKQAKTEKNGEERCEEEVKHRLAIAHYTRLSRNFAHLATIDHQSMVKDAQNEQSTTLDLFKANKELSESVQKAAQAEQEILAKESGHSLIARGHGLPLLHAGRVGTTIVYDVGQMDASSNIEHLLKAEQVEITQSNSVLHKVHVEALPASIALHKATDHQPNVRNLSSIPGLSNAAGVSYVAHVDPPTVLSRSNAERLHKILGWPITRPDETHSSPLTEMILSSDAKSDLWIGDLMRRNTTGAHPAIGSSSSIVQLRFSRSDANETQQVRGEEQGLLIDTIPFNNLSQLYAAIEVLQESVCIQKLVRSIPSMTPAGTEGQVVDISFGKQGIRLNTTLVNEGKLQAWHLIAFVSRSDKGGYEVQVELIDQFGSRQVALQKDDLENVAQQLQIGLSPAADKLVKIADQRIGLQLFPLDPPTAAATEMEVDASVNETSEPPAAAAAAAAAATPPSEPKQESPQPRTSPSVRVTRRTSAANVGSPTESASKGRSPPPPSKRRRSSGGGKT